MTPPEWLGAYSYVRLTERQVFPVVIEFHLVYTTARNARVDAIAYVNKAVLDQPGGRDKTIAALVDQARAQMDPELLAIDPTSSSKPGCKPC